MPVMVRARRRSRPAILTAALAAAAALAGGRADADIQDDAARLERIWKLSGARVARLSPVFAEHGRPRIVTVHPIEGPGGAAGCLTVALLAPRAVDFALSPAPGSDEQDAVDRLMQALHGQDPDEDRRVRSAAGGAAITRCGAERAELSRVTLDVSSGRAAVEVVVAASAAPLQKLESVLPERAAGPLAPRGDPGRPVEPGPLADRVARAERRARADGATRVFRVEMRASPAGAGSFSLKLPDGCHRLDVMAEVPTTVPRRATDIDLEAREADTGRLLERDRSDAPDGRIEVCLGEVTVVELPFQGASGAVKVVLSDARWPMPIAAPTHFGSRARAGFAAALRRKRAPAPRGQSLASAMGVQGETPVPIAVEPGRCYFAAVTLVRGDVRGLRIAAEIGDRAPRDDAPELVESAGVAFCAETEEAALLRVTARGTAPWWAVTLWPMD